MISPYMTCGTVRYTHDATLFVHEACESQSGDPQQGAGERCTHQNGIHTIHHTAVPLEQMAHVFDTDIALEHGSTQITERAHGTDENTRHDRHPPTSGPFRGIIRACEYGKCASHGEEHRADKALNGLLRRDARAELVFAELGTGKQTARIG